MRAAFVVLPVFSLVLAGCAEKVSDITGGDDREERTAGATPEARALNALAAVGDDMGADGEIRKMTMVATGGGYSGTVVLVLGADDRSSLSMDASGFSFRLVCSDETGVLTLSDRSYEARAGAFCEDGRFITEDESQDPFGTVTFEENENVKIVSVTRLPGGGSRIELEVRADADESGDADVEGADEDETPPGGGDVDGSDEDAAEDFAMSYVVYTDSKNRVVNMSMDAPQGGGRYEATFEYGKRGTIDVPSADARIPARVEHDDEFDAGTYSWEVDEAEDTVALSEFEVRVWTREAAEEGREDAGDEGSFSLRGRPTPTTPHLAAFPLEYDDEQKNEGFAFRFTDDGDGLLGEGDAFTLTKDGWEDASEFFVVVYDEWAARGIDDNPVPGAWALLAVGALAGAAMTVGRRRRAPDA